jgi:hypothetical protein
MPEQPKRRRHGKDFNYGSGIDKGISDYARGRKAGRQSAKMPTRKQVGSTGGGGGGKGKKPAKGGMCMLMLLAQIWMANDSEKRVKRAMLFPRFRSNAARGRIDATEGRKAPGQARKEAVERLGHAGLLGNRRYTNGKQKGK